MAKKNTGGIKNFIKYHKQRKGGEASVIYSLQKGECWGNCFFALSNNKIHDKTHRKCFINDSIIKFSPVLSETFTKDQRKTKANETCN
jgi:hypothetical protein